MNDIENFPGFDGELLQVNDQQIYVASAGEGPLVLFVHGWPELWLSWRHQINFIKDKGYRAVAMDVRGYGNSSKPHAIDQYTMRELTADVVGVIEALGESEAILVGHDWGAPIVWNTALRYPQHVRGVFGLSVPHSGRGEMSSLDLWKQMYTDQNKFFYQCFLIKEQEAEQHLEEDVELFLKSMYYSGSYVGLHSGYMDFDKLRNKTADDKLLPGIEYKGDLPFINNTEFAYYKQQFENSGMRGVLNRYRAQDLDWQNDADLTTVESQTITVPSAFAAGEADPVLSFIEGVDLVSLMSTRMTDLRFAEIIPEAGHWVQQEQADKINDLLLRFVESLN